MALNVERIGTAKVPTIPLEFFDASLLPLDSTRDWSRLRTYLPLNWTREVFLAAFELDAGGIELPLNWTREVLSCL